MRTVLAIVLCLVCACTGTRTGNPGHNGDLPSGVVVAQSELSRDEHPELSTANAETFGKDNRAFAFALYQELAKKPGNLFISPYSISTALAMTYAGAKSETASEMAAALHFTLPQSELHAAFNATNLSLAKRKDQLVPSSDGDPKTTGDGFELRVVNQAWGRKDYEFLDSYLDVLAVNYGAGMYLLDFAKGEASRKTINDWVADQTDQRIKDLLPKDSIKADTALVLTNAIYFKASWLNKFDPAATKPGTFTAESGARSVDMMHAEADAQYAMVDGYQAVALPYIHHKAFIGVDEEGTEAAAATAVVARTGSIPPHYTVAFDRPFMFLVYDRPTGQVLFLGHLADPG